MDKISRFIQRGPSDFFQIFAPNFNTSVVRYLFLSTFVMFADNLNILVCSKTYLKLNIECLFNIFGCNFDYDKILKTDIRFIYSYVSVLLLYFL